MVPVPNTCMAWLFLIPDPFWHNILLVCQVLLEIESPWGHTELCIADLAGKVSNIHLFFQIFPHVLSEGFLPAHLSPRLTGSFLHFPVYSLTFIFSPLKAILPEVRFLFCRKMTKFFPIPYQFLTGSCLAIIIYVRTPRNGVNPWKEPWKKFFQSY